YTDAHRAIYQNMLTLFERSHPVDLLTLNEELRRTEQLDLVGGPAALALLVEQASIAAHLTSYAHIVRDMAALRELIQTSTQIIAQAFDAKEDVATLVDDAERKIFSLAERRLEGSALPISKILKNTFEYIEQLYERKEHVTGVATGFQKLDLETSGFQPSDFIIIAARPSMGKAQPLDAPVKTPTGWTRMGALKIGDALASIDGTTSVVSGIFPQGRQGTYRVTFSDGRSTECTGEHLWRVHFRAWPEPAIGCGSTRRPATMATPNPCPSIRGCWGRCSATRSCPARASFSRPRARRCGSDSRRGSVRHSCCTPPAATSGASFRPQARTAVASPAFRQTR
ncbi:MAG: hypothetical protein HY216_07545, partial [Candidatus Rokubacteria bacterium]|nr:hypothetical protein [Candidatus Rokubacteria bacterium]